MKIEKTGTDEFVVTMTDEERSAMINCVNYLCCCADIFSG
jgi:hypothetical protein